MQKKNQKPEPVYVPKRSVEVDYGELSCLAGCLEFTFIQTKQDGYVVTFKGGTPEEVVVRGNLQLLYNRLRKILDQMEQELYPPPKGGLC